MLFIGHHKKSGLWLFNGGHIEKKETPKEALEREIKEEWGINVPMENLSASLLTVTRIKSNPAKVKCKIHYDIWFFIEQNYKNFVPDKNLLAKEFYHFGWKNIEEAQFLTKDPNTVIGIEAIEKII